MRSTALCSATSAAAPQLHAGGMMARTPASGINVGILRCMSPVRHFPNHCQSENISQNRDKSAPEKMLAQPIGIHGNFKLPLQEGETHGNSSSSGYQPCAYALSMHTLLALPLLSKQSPPIALQIVPGGCLHKSKGRACSMECSDSSLP